MRSHARPLTQGQTRWSIPPPFVMPDSSLIETLARALLAGEPTPNLLLDRCCRTLGRRWRWLRPLTERYREKFGTEAWPRYREVVRFLRQDVGLRRACWKHRDELAVAEWLLPPQQMFAGSGGRVWRVPAIESVGDLAKWLGLDPGELRWFADLKALGYKQPEPRLQHYHYRVLAKRFDSVRLIEGPKSRLKDLQRQILLWILSEVPPHAVAHGFVRGRSIRTFVAPHVGKRVVLRMDLRNFFPTFGGVRIQNVFRTFGYPERVADLLGGVCTNATPLDVWAEIKPDIDLARLAELRQLYARPHLPQGAPTSPALANICCYRLDCRLAALSASAGATYTRYADDLAFSGDHDFEKRVERFSVSVAAILQGEGLQVNHRKTRVMRQGVRQHLAGLVTNEKVNIVRRDFDQLKAVLTNCVRHGPESQNRERRPDFRSHLQGKVSFVAMINLAKGTRLRNIFERIRWEP
ncbi:MAG TPA: reverse transcriptase family protein [Candidatus Sulfotelmatobacter sp.]|nr:reverse transcriptase family protein [Candidatus Sulfotelmatobacter sp.]